MKRKIILSTMIALVCLSSMAVVFALSEAGFNPKDGLDTAQGSFGNLANNITGLVQFIGYVFAIGMLIYLGIKYVSSSANEKADLKKGAINYVIGAIVIVAAVNVFKLIVQFGGSLESAAGGGDGTPAAADSST